MPRQWGAGKKYVCGEYEENQIVNLFFVVTTETETREGWREGMKIKLLSGDYVLIDREFDKKARVAIFNLKRLEYPPPLPL